MGTPNGLKVFIRNRAGEYLTGAGEEWSFTPERALAHIFDYHADKIAEQLELAQRQLGVVWIATPVDPSLASETCDACGRKMLTTDAHFDGTIYLCPDCHTTTEGTP